MPCHKTNVLCIERYTGTSFFGVSVFCFNFAVSFNHKIVLIMTENSAEIKSIVGGLSSVIYQANGSSYRFNLTKMAKPFGKSVADWRKLKITQEYLTALQYIIDRYEDIHNVEPLLFTKQGGNVSNLEQLVLSL